jgi:hypothetical protein
MKIGLKITKIVLRILFYIVMLVMPIFLFLVGGWRFRFGQLDYIPHSNATNEFLKTDDFVCFRIDEFLSCVFRTTDVMDSYVIQWSLLYIAATLVIFYIGMLLFHIFGWIVRFYEWTKD